MRAAAPGHHADDQAVGTDWPDRLRAALRASGSPLAQAMPDLMNDTGLAHLHLRLPGTGVLARVPKQSQMQLPAAQNLAYQAACFERMAPSGHTPQLIGVLPPSAQLPRGALLVEEITGRAARLPADVPALMHALAAIHRLPLPAPAARRPLLDPACPLAALRADIAAQALHLQGAGVPQASRQRIAAVMDQVARQTSNWRPPATRLIAFDAHPGNFLVRADGQAVLVDLEKGRYGLAALDVAHATLYTSTTWDLAHRVALDTPATAAAYRCWQAALGSDLAGSPASWLVLRQLMWLWSVTWCAKWQAMAPRPADARTAGEDWSTALSDDTLVAHVRERVAHYLSAAVVEAVVEGFDTLAEALSG